LCWRRFSAVLGELKKQLARDRTRTTVCDFTQLGLVEMLLDEESVHLAGLSEFVGRPISLSIEPTMNPEQYHIALM
jgi:Ribonuclease G/E